jgi:hypothetical protein
MRREQMLMRDTMYLFGLMFGPAIAQNYAAVRPDAQYDRLVHLSNRAYDVWLPLYRIVSAFGGDELKAGVFNALDKLSQLDGKRRDNRDAEENTTGVLVQGLNEVLKSIKPLLDEEGIQYYDPDALYAAMIAHEIIPKSVKRKAFSGLINRVLDIPSVTKTWEKAPKRMYAIDVNKFDEYKKRYADNVER